MSLLFQYKRTLKRQEKAVDDFNAKCERSLTNKVLLHKNSEVRKCKGPFTPNESEKEQRKTDTHQRHFCFGSV